MTVTPTELRSYRRTGKVLFIIDRYGQNQPRLDFCAGRVSLEYSKEHPEGISNIDLTDAVGYMFPGDEICDTPANFFSIDLSKRGLTATGDFDKHRELVTRLISLRTRQKSRVRLKPPARFGEYLSRAYKIRAPAELAAA